MCTTRSLLATILTQLDRFNGHPPFFYRPIRRFLDSPFFVQRKSWLPQWRDRWAGHRIKIGENLGVIPIIIYCRSPDFPIRTSPTKIWRVSILRVLFGRLFGCHTPWVRMFKSADFAQGMDEMSGKQKCRNNLKGYVVMFVLLSYQNWNVPQTEMSPKLKCQ